MEKWNHNHLPTTKPLSEFVPRIFKDSQVINTSDAAGLVVQHGWTIAEAVELTGAKGIDVEKLISKGKKFPFTPTPSIIKEHCERFKRNHLAGLEA